MQAYFCSITTFVEVCLSSLSSRKIGALIFFSKSLDFHFPILFLSLLHHHIDHMYNHLYNYVFFCLTCFSEQQPKPGYEDLSRSEISYCKGIPLALKVLGI